MPAEERGSGSSRHHVAAAAASAALDLPSSYPLPPPATTAGASPSTPVTGSGGSSSSSSIVTTFRWPAAMGGHEVAVCGSFSDWQPLPLHRAGPSGGDFVRSLALPPGPAYFKYQVDGVWICCPTEQVVADGHGFNNYRCGCSGWRGGGGACGWWWRGEGALQHLG